MRAKPGTRRHSSRIGLLLAWVAPATVGAAQLSVLVDSIDVTGLPEVKAYATVLDANDEAVKGLRRDSFALEERPVGLESSTAITGFEAKSILESGQHLAISLVIDRSGSMKGEPLNAAREAVREFLGRISEGDSLALLSFADSVRTDSPSTTDASKVEAALDDLAAGGDTALYDAALEAVESVSRAAGATRKAVVLLTDGQRTTGSLSEPDPVKNAAVETGVRIFTVGLGREPEHEVLEELSEETGGAHFRAASPRDLLTIYQKIADRLHNQYVLTFRRDEDVRFHELTVHAVYGESRGKGSMKYLPLIDEVPLEKEETEPERQPEPEPQDWRPIVAVAVWALAVIVLLGLIIAARRRT